mmetsp:Transcript_8050/g.13516  ORF Transcript_8050/g.13516 Transcript_8050/m.13516 type:complete len:115 (-) Transcript_8050:72-416(-)
MRQHQVFSKFFGDPDRFTTRSLIEHIDLQVRSHLVDLKPQDLHQSIPLVKQAKQLMNQFLVNFQLQQQINRVSGEGIEHKNYLEALIQRRVALQPSPDRLSHRSAGGDSRENSV